MLNYQSRSQTKEINFIIIPGLVWDRRLNATSKKSEKRGLNWGIPVWNDDVFPLGAVSDKLISCADSEALQPPSAGSRLLPSYTSSAH